MYMRNNVSLENLNLRIELSRFVWKKEITLCYFLFRFPFEWKGFNRRGKNGNIERGKGVNENASSSEFFNGGEETGQGQCMTKGCRNHPLGYAGSCVGA